MGLQADLRGLSKAESKGRQERDQRPSAAEHHTGDGKEAAARHHPFYKGVNLNDRQVGTAEAGRGAAESDASGLPQLYRNRQGSRDLRALAAGADLEPESGSVDDPPGRDRERERDIRQS